MIKGLLAVRQKVCKECSKDYEGIASSKYCSLHSTLSNRKSKSRSSARGKLSCILLGIRGRCNKKKLPFDIDIDYLLELWNDQDGRCILSNEIFDTGPIKIKGRANRRGVSIDRIIPEFGYTKGNIRLVTFHMNSALNSFGLKALKKMVRGLKEDKEMINE